MLSGGTRQALERLQSSLQSWRGSVPERATAFHRLRGELAEQVRRSLSPWRLWIAAAELEQLNDRVEVLGKVVDGLARLMRRAEQLEREVQELERQVEAGDELAQWLRGRCREWTARLQTLGTDTHRAVDLIGDENTLTAAEDAIRLHSQALSVLREAEHLLHVVGTDVQAARLHAFLPELRRRLVDAGADGAWVEELRSLVRPLQPLASRIEDPPLALQTVSQLLTDVRGWSQQLGEMEREMITLEQRRHFFAADWTPAQIQELTDDARQLRDQLVEKARQRRDQRLAELGEQLDDLNDACGLQPDLQRRLDELKGKAVERYQTYRDWIAQHTQVRNLFLAIANTNEGALEARRDELVKKLQEGLEQASAQPLSDEVKRQVDSLAYDMRQLEKTAGAEDILRFLRRRHALQAQVVAIGEQAAQDIEQLSRQLAQLRAQNDELRRLGTAVGLQPPDLSQRLDELMGPESSSLEEARRRSDELAAETSTNRQLFVASCRTLLEDQLVAVRAATAALARSGRPLAIPALPEVAATASPQEAVEAVAAGIAAHQQTKQAVKRAQSEVEAKRRRAESELNLLPLATLGPAERELAERLREELATGSWSRARGLARLELTARLVEKCALLFARLQQEEQSARARLAAVREQLQAFTEDQLRQYCPELTDRVAALVYGIADELHQWPAIHHQLDVVEPLFARVQAQARRRAAAELELVVEVIKRRVRSPDGSSFKAAAEPLLAEVAAHGHHELPPVTLRLRALNLAARRGGGSR